MSEQASGGNGGADQCIVDRDSIAAAVQAAADTEPADAPELITGEPLLSGYLRDGVLQICGKLALAGAGPQLVENVAADMFRLLSVSANATRSAYRALLADLLPEPDAGATDGESIEAPRDHGAEDERS